MSLRLWAELGDTTRLSERVLGVLRFRWEEVPGRAALGSPPLLRGPSVLRAAGREALGPAPVFAPCSSVRPGRIRWPPKLCKSTRPTPRYRNASSALPTARFASAPRPCVSDQPQLGTRQPRDSVSPAAGGEGRVACRLVMRTCSVKRGPSSPSTPVRARVCTCERVRACPPGACFRSGGPRGLHDPAKPNREHPSRCGCGIEDRRETEFAGAHADVPSASGMRARTRGPASPRHRVPSLLRDAPAARSELLRKHRPPPPQMH